MEVTESEGMPCPCEQVLGPGPSARGQRLGALWCHLTTMQSRAVHVVAPRSHCHPSRNSRLEPV